MSALTARPAAGGPAAISTCRPAVPDLAGRTCWALGTFCSILVTRPAALDAAQLVLRAELVAIDLACSRFRGDSELSGLNRANGRPVSISPLFGRALAVALRAAELTDGDVDPTCGRSLVQLGYDRDYAELAHDRSVLTQPPVAAAGWHRVDLDLGRLTARVPADVLLDLGATAKALAADRAAAAAAERACCGVLVNLGGDIAVAGQAPDDGWPIRVDDATSDQVPVVAITSGGVATSSPAVRSWQRGTRRLHHICVPGTGQPAEVYWAAVSVAAASCVDANTASTASIIRGRSAPAWLEGMRLPARLAAAADGAVCTTAGWPR